VFFLSVFPGRSVLRLLPTSSIRSLRQARCRPLPAWGTCGVVDGLVIRLPVGADFHPRGCACLRVQQTGCSIDFGTIRSELASPLIYGMRFVYTLGGVPGENSPLMTTVPCIPDAPDLLERRR